MKEENGVKIYEDGEKPELPAGFNADFQVISRFGFKIVTIKGRSMWMAATENDYRKSEARRLGISEADVPSRSEQIDENVCHQTGPMSCSGFCRQGFCRLYESTTFPGHPHYYCQCSGGA